MDYCITYFSTAAESTNDQDILDIVEFSREKNARLGITGVLLYVNGSIVQVLEGEQQALEALYASIRADPRHFNVRTAINQSITQRLFDQWYMGYETLNTKQYDEVSALLIARPSAQTSPEPSESVILRMLKDFFDMNRQS